MVAVAVVPVVDVVVVVVLVIVLLLLTDFSLLISLCFNLPQFSFGDDNAVVVAAKRARHSQEEQLVAHSLLGLTGPVAASPAPSPLNFSFNLVPMAR